MTEGERERLYMLAEEAAEVIQMVNKILRHGYDSYHPNDMFKTSNGVLLQEEITDFLSIIDRMNLIDDIDVDLYDGVSLKDRWKSKLKYTRHQNNG